MYCIVSVISSELAKRQRNKKKGCHGPLKTSTATVRLAAQEEATDTFKLSTSKIIQSDICKKHLTLATPSVL